MVSDPLVHARTLLLDGYKHRRLMVAAFVIINALVVTTGLNWPKMYSSSTTVFVEQRNILGSLMEGAAEQTNVIDRAKMAKDIIYGRRILFQVWQRQGFDTNQIDPIELDRMIQGLVGRTEIENQTANIIRINYSDITPMQTYETTRDLAELFIQASTEEEIAESQSAFDFIEQQVAAYQKKLEASEANLEEFRRNNDSVRAGAEMRIRGNIDGFRDSVSQIDQEIREAQIRKGLIESQLSGEAESAAIVSRSDQYRIRIGEMEAELDTLRLNYHDTYPDIVRLIDQIANLRRLATQEEQKRSSGRAAASSSGGVYIDDSVASSPIAQALKGDLYNVSTEIAMLQLRRADIGRRLSVSRSEVQLIPDAENRLLDLTRDYDVNKEIYNDLLKRREIARVSVNVDRQEQGMSLRISEPAFIPTQPTGPRLLYFLIGGLLLGVFLPLGALFGLQQIDGKVRQAIDIQNHMKLPVLAIVPHLPTPKENYANMRLASFLVFIIVASVGLSVGVGYLRLEGLL
jgi:polysaccharide chain length determinant protein (PEP-CTERM system associated)